MQGYDIISNSQSVSKSDRVDTDKHSDYQCQ